MVLEQLHGRHDHARRTETALQSVTLTEGRLHRMQFAIVAQPFDRGDLGALRLDGQDRASLNGASIQMHGTGAALSGIATHVGSGEMQLITDQLDQKGPGINVDLNGTPIHGERKRFGGMAQSCLLKAADFLGVHLNPISILGQRGTKHARAFSSAIGFSLMRLTAPTQLSQPRRGTGGSSTSR
jgi:hypothetical protein